MIGAGAFSRALDRVLPDEIAGALYLSGPMTGIDRLNFPAFEAAAVLLRARGFLIVSPHEVKPAPAALPAAAAYAYFMRADLSLLVDAAGIVLLPGWPASRGAGVELDAAVSMGLPVFFYDGGELIRMDRPAGAPGL